MHIAARDLGRNHGAALLAVAALEAQIVLDGPGVLECLCGLDKALGEIDADHRCESARKLECGCANGTANIERAVRRDAQACRCGIQDLRTPLREAECARWAKGPRHLVSRGAKVQAEILVDRVVGLVDTGAVAALVEQLGRAQRLGIGAVDEAEPGVLVEVGPEVEARKDGGLVARGDPRAAHDHLVLAVVARGREVLVVGMHLGAFEGIEMVLGPLPDISKDIVMARGRRGVRIDGAFRRPCERHIEALALAGLVAAEGDADVGGVLGVGLLALVADEEMLCLGDQAVRGWTAVACGSPGRICLGLVVVDDDGPGERERDDFKEGAEQECVESLRAVCDPKGGPLCIVESAPLPAELGPVLALAVAAVDHKAEELAVGDEELLGGKVADGHAA
eukprot:comp21102_c0_seq1/m.44534 comp21102_c0_seq1/g.44534  ORF comp21102_c0_seq1/g.44534 comp21102_c0_seq1/m.44534 type:complete len:395 (-) comp21102_c0_seq1:775-1959(-)